uniref:Uncharacterized protein n=1 Tax=Arundo donax TaxID=35708 RepID=A0A0A9ABM7_ARUDO
MHFKSQKLNTRQYYRIQKAPQNVYQCPKPPIKLVAYMQSFNRMYGRVYI